MMTRSKLFLVTTLISSFMGLAHAAMTHDQCKAASEKMMKGDSSIDVTAYSTDCAQYEMDEATKASAQPSVTSSASSASTGAVDASKEY